MEIEKRSTPQRKISKIAIVGVLEILGLSEWEKFEKTVSTIWGNKQVPIFTKKAVISPWASRERKKGRKEGLAPLKKEIA